MHQVIGALHPSTATADTASTGINHCDTAPASRPMAPRSLKRTGGSEYAALRTKPTETTPGATRSAAQTTLSNSVIDAVSPRNHIRLAGDSEAARFGLPARLSEAVSATSLMP